MRRLRGVLTAALATAVGLGIYASPAAAAVTLGETFAPTAGCAPPTNGFQTTSPAATPFNAPSSGVITSWAYQAAGAPPPILRLKVARGTSTSLTIAGQSANEVPVANQLNRYMTRIAVQTGDVIGFFGGGSGVFNCGREPAGFNASFFNGADQSVGSNQTYSVSSDVELDVSANLEPDADGDGFGDETQDLCPSDPDTQKACPDKTAPETTITKQPKTKTKSKKATFEFSSSEPNSTFNCSLDGAPFDTCTSPKGYTVKAGRHSFTVLAKDTAGNVDDSPATKSWTVKKKRKK
jgi:hypothetical protein